MMNRNRALVLTGAVAVMACATAVTVHRLASSKKSVVDSLLLQIPTLRPLVDAGDTPFARGPGGTFVSAESDAASARGRVAATTPVYATGAFKIQGGGATATMQMFGAAPSLGESDRGSAVYRNAYKGVDVVATSRPERFELVYYVHERPSAPLTITLGDGVSARPEPSTGAVLLATRDNATLRLSGPVAIDARGVSRRGTYQIDGTGLTMSIPWEGLAYPIAIDPAVTVPTWKVIADDRVPGARTYDAERLSQEVHFATDSKRDRVVAVRPVRSRQPFDITRISGNAFGDDGQGDEFGFQRGSFIARTPVTGEVAPSAEVLADWRRGILLESETWEWDGGSWVLKNSAELPGLIDPSMAYDRERSRVVLYGGAPQSFGCKWNALYGGGNAGLPFYCTSADIADSTYEYDGTTWAAKKVIGSPSPRLRSAMAWDPQGKRTILFGGRQLLSTAVVSYNPIGENLPFPENMTGPLLNDTWVYDGTAWSVIPTGNPPPPLEGATLVYDEARHVAVLIGGHAGSDAAGRSDTLRIWEFDGTDWKERLTAGAPGLPSEIRTRRGVSAFWNPARQRVGLFGGQVDRLAVCSLTDAQISSQLAAASGNAAAIDLLASTGCLGGYAHDLWEWDGAGLSQVTGTSYGGMVDGVPVFRQSTLLGAVTSGGGSANSGSGAPLWPWRFDGSAKHYQLRTALERVHQTASPTSGVSPPISEAPPPTGTMVSPLFAAAVRPFASAASDGAVTMALADSGSVLSTTFGSWQDVTPSTTPFVDGAIDFAAAVWDEQQSRVVLFDPRTGSTWARTDTTPWAKLAVTGSPAAWSVGSHVRRAADLTRNDDALLALPKATYDNARGRVVMLFGHALWELGSEAWISTPVPTTLSSCAAATSMVYDHARARTVLFGCTIPASTWEWDGTSFTYIPQSPYQDLVTRPYLADADPDIVAKATWAGTVQAKWAHANAAFELPGVGVGTVDGGGTLRWWDGVFWHGGPALADGANCRQSRPGTVLRDHTGGEDAVPLDLSFLYAQRDVASCFSPPAIIEAGQGRVTAFRDGPRGMVKAAVPFDAQGWQDVPLGQAVADLAVQYSERISPYPIELMSPEHITFQMMTDPASRIFSTLVPQPVFPKDAWRAQDRGTDNLWWPYRLLRDPATKRVRVLTSRGALWELGGQVVHGLGESCSTSWDCAVGSCNVEGVCCDQATCGTVRCTTCKGTTPGVCQAVAVGQPDVLGKCGSGVCAGVCDATRHCQFDATRACGASPTCSNGVITPGGRCDSVSPACVTPGQFGAPCPVDLTTGVPTPVPDVTGNPCRMPDVPCGGGLGCGTPSTCQTQCQTRMDCKQGYTCGPAAASCVPDSATVAASARGVVPVDFKAPPRRSRQEVADLMVDAGGASRLDGGGVIPPLAKGWGVAWYYDPNHRTPLTGMDACLERIELCSTFGNTVDSCVAAQPRCAGSTPWLSDDAGEDCCPEACLTAYFGARDQNTPFAALRLLLDSACYPQLQEYLTQ